MTTQPPEIPSENRWTLTEFVEVLNEKVPMQSEGDSDGRRADSWNPRLVRHYTTSKVLPTPDKRGRQAFYGEQHLKEALRLTSLQKSGLTSKYVAMTNLHQQSSTPDVGAQGLFATSSDSQTALVNLAGARSNIAQSHDRVQALSLLDGWSHTSLPATGFMASSTDDAASLGMSENVSSTTSTNALFASTTALNQEHAWHRLSIAPGLQISLRDDVWDRENELRQLLSAWMASPSRPS